MGGKRGEQAADMPEFHIVVRRPSQKGPLEPYKFAISLAVAVVIVAAEEALSAVPRSIREGSLACGASKWQTIRSIVLPHALPGIMTGLMLAMARGAGEVAPLMLVGFVRFCNTIQTRHCHASPPRRSHQFGAL